MERKKKEKDRKKGGCRNQEREREREREREEEDFKFKRERRGKEPLKRHVGVVFLELGKKIKNINDVSRTPPLLHQYNFFKKNFHSSFWVRRSGIGILILILLENVISATVLCFGHVVPALIICRIGWLLNWLWIHKKDFLFHELDNCLLGV